MFWPLGYTTVGRQFIYSGSQIVVCFVDWLIFKKALKYITDITNIELIKINQINKLTVYIKLKT